MSQSETPQCADCGSFTDTEAHSTLRAALLAEKRRADGLQVQYHELLFAVGNKYPDETRHETALRYIRKAEEPGPDLQAAATEPPHE